MRRSWELLQASGDRLADLFYHRVFAAEPALRPRFPPDLAAQRRKFVDMLGSLVTSIDWNEDENEDENEDDREAELDPARDPFLCLLELGRHHARVYQIPDAAYAVVGEALLWALERTTAHALTLETREAWERAYALISRAMRLAAAHGETAAPAVLAGPLDLYSLGALLEVLALSRQRLLVELFERDAIAGRVRVQSGQVLAVERGADTGMAALRGLLAISGLSYRISRSAEPATCAEPLGAISTLMMEADDALDCNEPQIRGCAFALCSARGGVGRSTLALHVAIAIARSGRSTVLVDADPNADLSALLGALFRDRGRPGMYDRGLHAATGEDLLRTTLMPNLRFVPATAQPQTARPRAPSPGTWRALLLALRRRAEVVIVDTPAGLGPQTLEILAGCTDAVLVVRPDVGAARAVPALCDALRDVPGPEVPRALGVAINEMPPTSSRADDILGALAVRGVRVFATRIPHSAALADALRAGAPLGVSTPVDPDDPGLRVFGELAAELVAALDHRSHDPSRAAHGVSAVHAYRGE